jgi:predicted transcriptional regulator
MEAYIQQLEGGKAKLEKEVRVSDVRVILKYLYEVSDLKVSCQMVEKKAAERRQAEEKVS